MSLLVHASSMMKHIHFAWEIYDLNQLLSSANITSGVSNNTSLQFTFVNYKRYDMLMAHLQQSRFSLQYDIQGIGIIQS